MKARQNARQANAAQRSEAKAACKGEEDLNAARIQLAHLEEHWLAARIALGRADVGDNPNHWTSKARRAFRRMSASEREAYLRKVCPRREELHRMFTKAWTSESFAGTQENILAIRKGRKGPDGKREASTGCSMPEGVDAELAILCAAREHYRNLVMRALKAALDKLKAELDKAIEVVHEVKELRACADELRASVDEQRPYQNPIPTAEALDSAASWAKLNRALAKARTAALAVDELRPQQDMVPSRDTVEALDGAISRVKLKAALAKAIEAVRGHDELRVCVAELLAHHAEVSARDIVQGMRVAARWAYESLKWCTSDDAHRPSELATLVAEELKRRVQSWRAWAERDPDFAERKPDQANGKPGAILTPLVPRFVVRMGLEKGLTVAKLRDRLKHRSREKRKREEK